MLPVRTGAGDGEPGARQSKNPFHTSLKVAMYIYKNYDNPTLLNRNYQINLQVLLFLLTHGPRKGIKYLSSSILKMNVRHGESQRRRGKDEVLDIAQSGGWALLNRTLHFANSIKSVNQQNNE